MRHGLTLLNDKKYAFKNSKTEKILRNRCYTSIITRDPLLMTTAQPHRWRKHWWPPRKQRVG